MRIPLDEFCVRVLQKMPSFRDAVGFVKAAVVDQTAHRISAG